MLGHVLFSSLSDLSKQQYIYIDITNVIIFSPKIWDEFVAETVIDLNLYHLLMNLFLTIFYNIFNKSIR